MLNLRTDPDNKHSEEMENQARPSSCSDIEQNRTVLADSTAIQSSVSLPALPGSPQSLSSLLGSSRHQGSNSSFSLSACDPGACGNNQKIMERLIERLFDLENERAELLAANRTWATQFQLMQERHDREVKDLKERLAKKQRQTATTETSSQRHGEAPGMTWNETRDQMNVLKHQAEVYREDFLEERKSRVRAHAQLDALRNELKRERKSRAKLVSIVNESARVRDDTPKVCN